MYDKQSNKSEAKMNGHKKRPLLKAIRAKCLDCCIFQPKEIRLCTSTGCDLWPYRMGKNPFSSRGGSILPEKP